MSEDTSAATRHWLATQDIGECVVSDWVVTELASALAMKVRTGQIQSDERTAALSFFQSRMVKTFDLRAVSRANFHRAYEIMNLYTGTLRAADALHLAIAEETQSGFATYDIRQASAAQFLKLVVLEL